MRIEERIAHFSEATVSKEISSIVKAMSIEPREEIAETATGIARDFFKTNRLVDPITLARASLYIAMKRQEQLTEDKIKLLVHSNGTTNRWWMYLVPLVERRSKVR